MKKMDVSNMRILLIEDHPTMRAGLSMILSHMDYVVCGEAENREQLIQCVDTCNADAAVLDISLDGENGLELLDILKQRGIAALVYSMHENWGTIEEAFERGVRGYVTKRESPGVLLEALEHVLAGKRFISPGASCGLSDRILSSMPASQVLSTREEQIMDMLGNGETNGDIAEKLNLSPHTVQTYYARIMEKLGLRGMKNLRKAAINKPR